MGGREDLRGVETIIRILYKGGNFKKEKKIKLNPALPLSLRIKDGVRFSPKKESENPCLESTKLSIN